jgi:MFS family permease
MGRGLVAGWPRLGSSIIGLLINCALETSLIFLPLFADGLGASKLEIGVIGGAYGGSFFISSLFFSRQSDIKGRLAFVRVGLGLGAAALAAQTLVTSPAGLMVARAVVGFCFGVSMAALVAYNFEVSGGTALFAALGALGWLLGEAIAVFTLSYTALFLLGAAFCALAFLFSFSLKEERNRSPLRPATKRVIRRNIWVYLPFFLRQVGANMVWAMLPLFFMTLGASRSWVAILAGVNTGGQFIVMLFVERLRESRLFITGFVLSAAVFLSYALATSYLQLVPVQVLLALAWSSIYVGALLLLLKKNQERATATGVLFSTLAVAAAVGPTLGGVVSELWGFQTLMLVSCGLCLVGLGMVIARKG